MKRNILLMAMFSMLVLASCDMNVPNEPTQGTTYYGETRMIGQGFAKTWVKLDNSQNPTSVGLTFSESVLTGLPESELETVFMLPSQASKTVFNHLSMDWNNEGHPPAGVYDLPHFDFHFYMISQSERALITGDAADSANLYMAPGEGYLAHDYYLPPGFGVPNMGEHAIDSTSGEFHGDVFDYTLIYGYYMGKMIFIEPMVTRAFLMSKQDVNQSLKLPEKYSKTGYYPTKWSLTYDASAKEYTLALTNMVYRSAQ